MSVSVDAQKMSTLFDINNADEVPAGITVHPEADIQAWFLTIIDKVFKKIFKMISIKLNMYSKLRI